MKALEKKLWLVTFYSLRWHEKYRYLIMWTVFVCFIFSSFFATFIPVKTRYQKIFTEAFRYFKLLFPGTIPIFILAMKEHVGGAH